jgi:hypothetical protein
MLKKALVFALLLATTPGLAIERNAEWCERIQPPPQFRKPVTVEYEVMNADPEMVKIVCGFAWIPPNLPPGGCVQRGTFGEWEIWINDEYTEYERACLLGHELGHLPPNNWRHRPPYNAFQDETGKWRPRVGPRTRNHP